MPMPAQWYYGYGRNRFGPFSSDELRALADGGRIQPMDTVWKEGIEVGVPAHRIKDLFPLEKDAGEPPLRPSIVDTLAECHLEDSGVLSATESVDQVEDLMPEAEPEEDLDAAEPEAQPHRLEPATEKKGRATVLRGAIISSQDGTSVYYRKKCIKCGLEETGRSRLPIRNGITRTTFFCPRCRKAQPVEIQGSC
jgi:hypothetical protein